MITQGQFVKLIFRNGAQAEGFVESWTNTKAILSSEDKTSSLIIMDVSEDVMLVKIMQAPKPIKQLEKENEIIKDEFDEAKGAPFNEDLKLKKLADLKDLMRKQEKNIISAKLKEPKITERVSEYKYPSFFKKDIK